MGLVAILTGTLDEMKWECLAIILEIPLKEEWVSTFRICLKFPVNLSKFISSHHLVFFVGFLL